ncbi:hypothetical protein DFH09DRAFT_1381168 [Mycena vulgaris]|nr:hypothetical protein DFH09DRAFT_1381168 [Mycena vulgaris]
MSGGSVSSATFGEPKVYHLLPDLFDGLHIELCRPTRGSRSTVNVTNPITDPRDHQPSCVRYIRARHFLNPQFKTPRLGFRVNGAEYFLLPRCAPVSSLQRVPTGRKTIRTFCPQLKFVLKSQSSAIFTRISLWPSTISATLRCEGAGARPKDAALEALASFTSPLRSASRPGPTRPHPTKRKSSIDRIHNLVPSHPSVNQTNIYLVTAVFLRHLRANSPLCKHVSRPCSTFGQGAPSPLTERSSDVSVTVPDPWLPARLMSLCMRASRLLEADFAQHRLPMQHASAPAAGAAVANIDVISPGERASDADICPAD